MSSQLDIWKMSNVELARHFPNVEPARHLPQNGVVLPSRPNLGIWHPGPVIRMPSSKLPRGRHLMGENLVYDIDVRFPGEVQPQLEVTPITKYGSDPGLVLGRQIAVNKTYICYGLKLGAIRVLNINTALRSLLKGLAQRVTDMVFFAEDVHLLASASMDGRVYVWKIIEGPDEEDKRQITGSIVIALQITGAGESVYPRVCWHSHKQEAPVVGIGKHVLKIDTTKVGKGQVFSAEESLKCPVEKLPDGVQLVGTHDGEVTDLSMCQWMTTRLVSASVDGTMKIWEDRKSLPIAVLWPHDGQPTLRFDFVNNSRVHHLRSINSKNAHFSIFACNNMNISHVKIMAPSNSHNTDGIHIGSSRKIQISQSTIGTGDDCIAMIAGSQNIDIFDVFCGPGHGISIGSLGRDHENDYVQGIHIRNCTFSGTENGVRIKTWSPSLKSLASDMKFEDIFIKNASNSIVIDQEYCPRAPCIPEGQSTSDVQIKNVTFKNIWGTSISKVAVNLECSKKVPCQKIEFININLSYNGHGIATSVCANVIDSSYTKKMPPGCV